MQSTSRRTISDFITPSDEILGADGGISTENLLDEVNLYNIYDAEDVPEKDAERILRITYPTRTLENIIKRTTRKLDQSDNLEDGAHVIAGDYGSGKSHVGLVLYHLLDDPELGQKWLNNNGIDATLPKNSRVSALQMFNLDEPDDRAYTRLWEPVYRSLGGEDEFSEESIPTVADIRDLVDDEPTMLFIDEIERWLNTSSRRDYKDDNLVFLQNLLEAAGRDDTPLVLFLSLLYNDAETKSIAERTNPFTHNLTARRDEKIQFLTHRLVGSRDDPEGIAEVADSYIDAYETSDVIDLGDYQEMEERIEQYYPFHPYALDLLMRKFSGAGTNDARGLLSFLTEVLADNYSETDLILTSDVDVASDQILDRLYALDPELLQKYEDDHDRLKGDDGFDTHVEELLNIVLLYSLGEAGDVGTNSREMLMGTLRPEHNSHEILQTFTTKIEGFAWHVHKLNGEYSFELNENPAARIEKKSEDVHRDDAIHRIENLVLEKLFDDKDNVYIWNPVNTEQEIEDTQSLKLLIRLDHQRSYDDDFKELVDGWEYTNTLVVIGPESDIQSNTGLIKMAKSVVAGELLNQQGGDLPDGFNDNHQQNYDNLLERVKDKFGIVYLPKKRRDEVRLVPTQSSLSVRDNENYYDATLRIIEPDSSDISKAVRNILDEYESSGLQYKYVQREFYWNAEYPIIADSNEFEEVILDLCADGEISIDGTINERPSSIGSNSTLLHGDYVSGSSGGGTSGGTSGGDGGSSGIGPDIGGSSGGSTGVTGGGNGGSSDDDDDDDDKSEELPKVTFPAMPPLTADNKFSLVDKLERDLGDNWDIHFLKVTIKASLDEEDLERRGLGNYSEMEGAEIEDTFTKQADTPFSKRRVLDIIEDLVVPSDATLEVRMEVVKNE